MSLRTPEEVFSWAEGFTNYERGQLPADKRAYRLERMRSLLALFGNPETSFRSIHVAGTKGKGSTAALLAAALTASGKRTGLYTSPHVASARERVAVDGMFPDPATFARIGEGVRSRIAESADRLPGGFSPTTFELYTLLAFLAFREARCSEAVVEVGIGGRLDATNVIMPAACVITPLDLEHTDILGTTIGEIAFEKAGIIKAGVPTFAARQLPAAREVFLAIAAERGAPLALLDDELERLAVDSVSPAGTSCTIKLRGAPPASFDLALVGGFQAENAALAWLALSRSAFGVSVAQAREGFRGVRLPGRVEVVPGSPALVLDGAHTPLAVRRLLETFRALYPRGGVLLFGSVAGKKPREMAEILAPEFDRIVISTPAAFKLSDPSQVHAIFRALRPTAELVADPASALARARELAGGEPVLVTGSFYMVSEVRSIAMKAGTA